MTRARCRACELNELEQTPGVSWMFGPTHGERLCGPVGPLVKGKSPNHRLVRVGAQERGLSAAALD
jgi:hypothetical protein